ncbi:hypothetical protein Gogos_021291, partial [Gossypium gossypioides]|nr:hypothetical protein [Gossypium gossypioides]
MILLPILLPRRLRSSHLKIKCAVKRNKKPNVKLASIPVVILMLIVLL